MSGNVLDINDPWFESDDDRAHFRVVRYAKSMQDRQKSRASDDWRHARLYAGMRPDLLTAFGALGYISANTSGPSRLPRFSFNVIESVIETAASRVAAQEIRPTAVTDGGDWDMQEKAEKLTQFIDGVFYATTTRELAVECAEDAMVFGTGALKIYEDEGEVRHERIFPLELLVDDQDGMYRKPRQLMQVRSMPREVVMANYGDTETRKNAIAKAPTVKAENKQSTVVNVIMVFEAWHLRSGKQGTDGRHVVCIDGCDLLDEKGWKGDRFPIEFLRWRKPLLGFWGRGLAEQLTGIQIEINRVVNFCQSALSGSAFKVFIEVGSKIVKSHISKEMGGIVEYQGAPPQYYAPETLQAQVINWLLMLYDKAFELAGVSKLAAAQEKPAGLDSEPALRTYSDVQDARFMKFGQMFEDWHVRIGQQDVDLARQIYEQQGKFSVRTPNSEFLNRIDWGDVNLDHDDFVLQVFPESALPRTPSARAQTIQEYAKAGLIPQSSITRLMRLPDLRSELDLDNSPVDFAKWQIAKMLHGKYEPPDELQDPAVAQDLVTRAYLFGRTKGVPESRLKLFRLFLRQLDGLQQLAAANQAPAPAAPSGMPPPSGVPGGVPTGRPTPAPTSDLLPSAPMAA